MLRVAQAYIYIQDPMPRLFTIWRQSESNKLLYISPQNMAAQEEFDAKEAFQKIYQRAVKLGISGENLASLKSYNNLSVQKLPFWVKHIACSLLIVIHVLLLLAVLLLLLVQCPEQRLTLYKHWFEFYDTDIGNERCLIEYSPFLLVAARPPVNCDMCKDVEEVDRVTNLSAILFESKYAYSGRPVVVEDGMRDWTDRDIFNFEFFKNVYKPNSPVITGSGLDCWFNSYKSDFNDVAEVFEMNPDDIELKDGSNPWYIGWSNCDSAVAEILRKHYSRPYFLPKHFDDSHLDWIFMGTPGYGADLHVDNVGRAAWQAQIRGIKKWNLEPPPECYHVCKPKFEFLVNPGEILVVAADIWFHATLVLGDELSVSLGSEYY